MGSQTSSHRIVGIDDSSAIRQQSIFHPYKAHQNAWDDLLDWNGKPHPHCKTLVDSIGKLSSNEFQDKRSSADLAFVTQGITFSVYSDCRGVEKIFPFDLVPRPIEKKEWSRLEIGLKQRTKALNLFLFDVYHDQKIINDNVIPREMVESSKGFRKEMIGFTPPGKQYIHIVGTDLIRNPDGDFLVLEDNGRTPSGVSYVIENRVVMKRIFPDLFKNIKVRRVEDYPQKLREALCSVAPASSGANPRLALLTPGPNAINLRCKY